MNNNKSIEAVPIWIYYTDIDTGKSLASPTILRGIIGDKYDIEVPRFDGYRLLKHTGEMNGIFSDKQQETHLYFRIHNWTEVDEVQLYATICEDLPTYDSPNGNKLKLELPTGTVWRTFLRVSTSDGQFWYKIGINQWILYKPHVFNLNDSSKHLNNSLVNNNDMNSRSIDAHGVIDFANDKSLTYYARPYGKAIGKVKNNTSVTIDGQITDQAGIVWFHIKDLGFINAMYVSLTSPINVNNIKGK